MQAARNLGQKTFSRMCRVLGGDNPTHGHRAMDLVATLRAGRKARHPGIGEGHSEPDAAGSRRRPTRMSALVRPTGGMMER